MTQPFPVLADDLRVGHAASATHLDPAAVERFLHQQIPLTQRMEVAVAQLDSAGVRLAAPLGPNVNHRQTAFGGSASALAILSAWTLVYVRTRALSFPTQIVIQRNAIEYLQPITGSFEAFCPAPSDAGWRRFLDGLVRKGRARIRLGAELSQAGTRVGTFEGSYVVSKMDQPNG